jgi:ATP-dependent Clp protease ATP-binding subunit ClpA
MTMTRLGNVLSDVVEYFFPTYGVAMAPEYSRFTDRARKVMQLANQEAQRLNHEYVGTEHMLLGLIKEGSGVAANVLKNLDVNLNRVRAEAERIIQTGPGGGQVVMGRMPLTPQAKKAIEYAVEEGQQLKHNYVGTEHLLLGLLREVEGVAAQVLMNLGVRLNDIRDEVMNILGVGPELRRAAAEVGASSGPDERVKELDEHIEWLEMQKEALVILTAFEKAAEIQTQLDKLRRFRGRVLGG